MTRTVGDFIVARLHDWGVRRIFGYPGDGINGVFGAMSRAEGKIEFIQARHEEMASFMASAHAKFSGELGVCIATSGPGASHLLTGLYDAQLDHQPVLAIVGQQARTALGAHYQQELDLQSLFKDVAGAYVEQASASAQVRHMVDRAIRTALSQRKVTALILPNDLQELPYEDPPRKHGAVMSGVGYAYPRVVPFDADLDRAAAVLNAGSKVAMLVGAELCTRPTRSSPSRKSSTPVVQRRCLAKRRCLTIWPGSRDRSGYSALRPSYRMMMECDTLFMIGSGFPYSEFLPKEGQARGVQIDLSGRYAVHSLPDGSEFGR